jgi:predicted alpha/beta superfamily hydrolase
MKHLIRFIKPLIFIYSSLFLLPGCMQKTSQVSGQSTKTAFAVGETIKLHYAILNEDYNIHVSTPDDYEKTTEKYPVIYVLDGKYHFPIVTAAANLLYGYQKIPKCIVVGIETNNRDRDYTPPLVSGFSKPGPMSSAGGADKYLEYIEKELLPFIDKNYRTQPYRTIIGHSLGGLLVVHTLVTRPSLFQAHVNIDGSLWYNDGAEGNALISYLKNNPGYKGNFMWVKEKMEKSYWFPITKTLHVYLEGQKPGNLNYKFIEIENEEHETLIYPGAYTALRELYKKYRFRFSPTSDLGDIKKHYDSLSVAVNYKVNIPENVYAVDVDHCKIVLKSMDKALITCEEWMKDYPNSALAFETTGNTYLEMGKKDLAMKYLKRSSELNPGNNNVKESLKKLQ